MAAAVLPIRELNMSSNRKSDALLKDMLPKESQTKKVSFVGLEIEEVKSEHISHVITPTPRNGLDLVLHDVKIKPSKYGFTMTVMDEDEHNRIANLVAKIEETAGVKFENTLIQEFNNHYFYYVSTTKFTTGKQLIEDPERVYFGTVVIRPSMFKKHDSDDWKISLKISNVFHIHHSIPKYGIQVHKAMQNKK